MEAFGWTGRSNVRLRIENKAQVIEIIALYKRTMITISQKIQFFVCECVLNICLNKYLSLDALSSDYEPNTKHSTRSKGVHIKINNWMHTFRNENVYIQDRARERASSMSRIAFVCMDC